MKVLSPFPKLQEMLQKKFNEGNIYGTLNYGCAYLDMKSVARPIYNPPRAVRLAIDKIAGQDVLETYHLVPPLARKEMGKGTYIVKPQTGMKGQGIYFTDTPIQKSGYICQVFIPTVCEYRVIVALETIVGIYKKYELRTDANPRIRNAQYGWEWELESTENDEAERVAIRSALIMGLDVCGIDVGIRPDGTAIVFEVNSASWLNRSIVATIFDIFEKKARSIKRIRTPIISAS